MDNNQQGGLFGKLSPSYGGNDPSYNVPVTSRGNLAPLSPYLNFDPSVLNQPGSEYIFPEGAARQRGRFELAFSQIGGSVMAGAMLGGVNGFYTGVRETKIAGHIGSVRRTQMLNFITKQGAASANSLGVVALMYSGFGVLLSWVRGTDDELNTLTAATVTGLLYKSSAGLKKCAMGGGIGLGVATAYCLWTSRERVSDMIGRR